MPDWIIAAALGSVAITALLAWILWRMNRPAAERTRQDANSGDGSMAVYAAGSGGSRRQDSDRSNDNDGSDSGSDGGGSGGSDAGGSGGGDGGGGGGGGD